MRNDALRTALTVVLLGILPVAVLVAMFAVAHTDGSLSVDFQNELYPEAKRLLHWQNPFPPSGTDLSHGHNLIWPPVAALLVAPFTVLSAGTANWAIAIVGIGCFMASLRIVGVRDWRVFGAFLLWPQVVGEIRVSHLTPILVLLLALVWRHRETRQPPASRSAWPARSSSSCGPWASSNTWFCPVLGWFASCYLTTPNKHRSSFTSQ